LCATIKGTVAERGEVSAAARENVTERTVSNNQIDLIMKSFDFLSSRDQIDGALSQSPGRPVKAQGA
jgi:NACalpha-BTF3-like transcription factor